MKTLWKDAPGSVSDALRVRREDIEWRNVSPEVVRITVTVHNAGAAPTEETEILLQAAPFGAFLPWKPLARLQAPPLRPGGSARLVTEAFLDPVRVVGNFLDPPRERLLTALGLLGEGGKRDRTRPPWMEFHSFEGAAAFYDPWRRRARERDDALFC